MSTCAFQYTPLTDLQIRHLTEAIYTGYVFTSTELPKDKIKNVFIPLRMKTHDEWLDIMKSGVIVFYEYTSDMRGTLPDGNPYFYSYKTLDENDFEKVYLGVGELEGLH